MYLALGSSAGPVAPLGSAVTDGTISGPGRRPWLLERTGLIGADPFASVSNALIDHRFTVAAAFALLAALAHYGMPASAALADTS
jgi:hypothetical protein